MTAADVTIDLAQGTASSTETGHDQLASIENACGGSGNDTLIASQEVNALTGGDGADTFVFGSVAAIGRGEGHRDRILDFAVGDRIDLDKISDEFIDDLQAFGDQVIRRFVLIGEQEAFTKPGQLRVKYQELDDHQITILEGNINCDADAEFELELLGFNNLQDENFIQHQ